jgi:ketosteroid isomerase-like protein
LPVFDREQASQKWLLPEQLNAFRTAPRARSPGVDARGEPQGGDTASTMPSTPIVRKPLSVRARPRRAPEDHLLARFPRLYALFARALSRLPPQSRIRQALIWRTVELSLAATNRRDFEAVLPRYDPDVELVPARELVSLGIAASYRGHEGFLNLWKDWDSAWAGHAQWEPTELIDLGDRLLILARMRGIGETSGIAVDTELGLVATLRSGRVIREEHYIGPAQALEAVGLAA